MEHLFLDATGGPLSHLAAGLMNFGGVLFVGFVFALIFKKDDRNHRRVEDHCHHE